MVILKYGFLVIVVYDFGGGCKFVYVLEGSIVVVGFGVKFFMNNLGFVDKLSVIIELVELVEDNGGVVFVIVFSGLFVFYWIDDVKGIICKYIFFFVLYCFLIVNVCV